MKKIVFMTPPDARYGFSLTGVGQRVTPDDARTNTLRGLTGDPAVGLVIIDERLVDASIQEQLAETERLWPGLVVVLPAPEKAERPAEDYALRLIRRAVGYQVRLSL
jgi:V/A-type H+-transporting ATPase subunit F